MKCPHCKGTGKLGPEQVNVGVMILAMRNARQLTQQDVANKAGLSRAQIANIEVGRSDIPVRTLALIASALDCSMKDLVP